jgi:membrane associated rhomboid family serine protease
MRRAGSIPDLLSFGGRVPPAVGGVIAALVVASALSSATGAAGWLLLSPRLVLEGEGWRLLTWAVLETNLLNLVFAALTLFWFGRDLAHAWGPRRFLAAYAVLGGASAAVTSLLALVLPGLASQVFDGAWVVVLGLLVAWGMLYPDRQMQIWGVLPLSGRGLVWVTVGGTVLYAAFGGGAGLLRAVPSLASEGLAALWLGRRSRRSLWYSVRAWIEERRLRRRARHLQVVRKDGRGGPPRWLN